MVNGGWYNVTGVDVVTQGRPIPPGGDLVLGQQQTTGIEPTFDPNGAFVGELGFVNIWRRAMTRDEVAHVFGDCFMMQCGDAVEWADFRSGTKGELRIRWPSRIYGKRR